MTQSAVSPPQRTSPVFVADLLYPCDWHRKTWAPRPKYSTLLQFSVPCQFQLQKDATLLFCRRTNSTASLSFQPSSSVSPVQAQYPPRPPHIPFLNSLAPCPPMPSLPSLSSTSSSLSSPLATSSAVTGSQATKQIAWQAALYLVVTLGSVYVIIRTPSSIWVPSPHPLSSFLFTNSHRRHLRRPHPAHLERRCTETDSST